jgi:hypothetical protein
VTEVVTRTALLGLRFWDAVTGRVVAAGLRLTDLRTGTEAIPTPSGAFVLHDVAGLTPSALGAGDARFWASPPAKRSIVLQLTDTYGRFQPFRFDADVPHRGLFVEDCPFTSPSDAAPATIPLYSSASRIAPDGIAVIRADLWDVSADAPAAWAVVEAAPVTGPSYRGIAGPDGRVVVLFPYPEPRLGLASPPGTGALSQQTWPVSISLRYSPAQLRPPPAVARRAGRPITQDLCDVLGQQPASPLDAPSPPTPLATQTVTFGHELILRSSGQPVLFVLPA